MTVWALETDTDFTTFYFPLKEDKIFFHELVEKYFDELNPVLKKWRLLFMLRGEPMKHPNFFEIDGTDVLAMSQKAVDCLHTFFNDAIELLPIETDAGRYYALNVLNVVDCLNKEESEYVATNNNVIVNYSLLEFDKRKLGNNSIFKIPELPYRILISNGFQGECEKQYLQGLVFDTESNLIWYSK